MDTQGGDRKDDERENKLREVVLREKEIEDKIKELNEREQRIIEKEKQIMEREKEIKEKQKELDVKLGRWEEVEENMEINSGKLNSVVNLNVGGKRYSVYKKDLLKHKGTYFEALITSQHNQVLENGEIFINRDGKLFYHILKYIKTGKVKFPKEHEERIELEQEFEFFKLHSPVRVRFFPRLTEGILTLEQQQVLSSWLPNQRFNLRYKASVDGFSAESFHKHIDHRPKTLSIVRTSQGFIFGGYSSLPWESVKGYKSTEDCFIFTLSNPHNLPPTRFFLKADSKRSIWCNSSDLLSFGNGDVHIVSDSNKNSSSYFYFPYSYHDTAGKGNLTFTGSQYFTTDEIEVYSIEN